MDKNVAKPVCKVFMFDLDGTLLNENHEINASTLRAIEQARKQNALFTVGTGRCLDASLRYLQAIEQDQYALLCNGALLYSLQQNKTWQIGQALSWTFLNPFFDYLINTQTAFLVYSTEYSYQYLFHHAFDPFTIYLGKKTVEISHLHPNQIKAYFANIPVLCMSIYSKKIAYAQFDAYLKPFKHTKHLINYTTALKNYLDIYHFTQSKYHGFLELLKRWPIDLNHFYYFGDSDNDLQMLQNVPNGITPLNGNERCKKLAKHILPGDHNSDALAEFITQTMAAV